MHYLQMSASIVKKATPGLGQNANHIGSVQSGSAPKKPTQGIAR
jgi:hypothetical protein